LLKKVNKQTSMMMSYIVV